MTRRFYQGRFRPTNPQKYVGNADNIVYRSLWELKMMKWLDMNSNVVRWASEELVVPYVGIDNKPHRYYPDFLVQILDKTLGKPIVYMVEVKPHKQSVKPNERLTRKNGKPRSAKSRQRIVEERAVYMTNERKWKAAEAYCAERGWKFMVLTERDVGF